MPDKIQNANTDDLDVLSISDIQSPPPADVLLPAVEVMGNDDIILVEDLQTGEDEHYETAVDNRHFRCLGYLNSTNYFMSCTSGQIFSYTSSQMKALQLIALAPREHWMGYFGAAGKVNWEAAADALIQRSYRAGVWNPRSVSSLGARLDGGVTVFNTGSKLFVEGQNIVPLNSFRGENCYVVGPKCRTPAFDNPFTAECYEPREYLELLSQLDWRSDRRELSIMALFGWVAISPICGILNWRPHVWLDGPRGSGKSWITKNLIKPVLGDYVLNILANSTESGIRNSLNNLAVPVLFDEAEGEDTADRVRMAATIKLARHSAFETDAFVTQGVAGGGSQVHYGIASTFFMTSIVPQLATAADNSRFARLLLASGRKHEAFARDIEIPANDLLTPAFSDRWIARMVRRATDYHRVFLLMVHALCKLGLERRIADVYGTFATGAWLMLEDGVPANVEEAAIFMSQTFNVFEQLEDFGDEISEDKDHNRLLTALSSHEVRLDGRNNTGTRVEPLGLLIQIASGLPLDSDTENVLISTEEARAILTRLGFRMGVGEELARDNEVATTVFIHKKAPPIAKILEKTPYANSYPDVIHQADDVKMGKPVRFGAALGNSRSVIVPLKHFSIGNEL